MNFFEITIILRKRVKYFNLSSRAQHSVKEQLYFHVLFFIEIYLKTYGLEISKLELQKYDGEIFTNCNEDQLSKEVKKQSYSSFKKKFKINETNEIDHVLIQQTAKDKANLSDKTYSAFRKRINKSNDKFKLLSINKLNIFKKKLNQFFKIEQNILGCYVDAFDKIKFTLKKVYERLLNDNKTIENNTFKIHLSGDGCRITRTRFNIINFTFKVLNDSIQNTTGLYTLGIFQINSENYETIKIALNEIILKLEQIKTITINGNVFKIEYSQGGDLKGISLINGINSAISKQPCPWCTWDKTKNLNLDDIWKIDGRSLEKAAIKLNGPENDRSGYINKPLFSFIDFNKTMIDPLHLCLRITDKIFDKLFSFFESFEGNSCDLEKRPLLKRFNEIVEIECSISSPFYLSKNESKVKLRSLNQNERLKILKAFQKKNISERFPELESKKLTIIFNFVICEFYDLFIYAKNDYTELVRIYDPSSFKSRLTEWLKMYLKLNVGEKITPYIHAFVFHVPQFIEEYKNLNFFSTQSLEQLNSVTKTHFFRNTNKKRKLFLQQLMEKANRIEFINLKGTTAEIYEKVNAY